MDNALFAENRIRLIKALDDIKKSYKDSYEFTGLLSSILDFIKKKPDVALSEVPGNISYLRAGSRTRIRTNLPRFVRRHIGIDYYSCSDYSLDELNKKFVFLTSKLESIENQVKILNGKAISDYYRNLASHSCMTGPKAKFVALYSMYPDKISLVTTLDNSRALLWNCDDGATVLDRIYPAGSISVYLLRKWAEEKGCVLRNVADKVVRSLENVYLSDNKQHFVTLPKGCDLQYYPYLDTFTYGKIVGSNLVLSNYCTNEIKQVYHSPNGTILYIEKCDGCNTFCLQHKSHLIMDKIYCEECIRTMFVHCGNCNSFCKKTNKIKGYYYCDKCISSSMMDCSLCKSKGFCHTVSKIKDVVCKQCLQEYYDYCDDCGWWHKKAALIRTHRNLLCKQCYDVKFTKCSKCEVHFEKNGNDICDKCINAAAFGIFILPNWQNKYHYYSTKNKFKWISDIDNRKFKKTK